MINKYDITECLEEISFAMQVLKEESIVTEVRILNANKGTLSGYYDDYDKLATDITQYIGKYNIYFTINPVKQELLARSKNHLTEYAKTTTTDADIEKRDILMIDLDAKRAAGISSSDEEHQKAIEKAEKVKEFLTEQGWAEPVVADSGNGAHLLYYIDIPNDKKITELVKNVLKALDVMFTDDAVEVDKSTYNAARICKVYGTAACKGDDIEERPHRMAKIISYPEEIEIVKKEQLQSVAAMLPVEEKETVGKKKTKFDLNNWMEVHGIKVASEKISGNAKIYVLEKCPWREEHTNHSAYIIHYNTGAIAAGCHHNSCSDENWHTLRDKLEPDWKKKTKASKEDGEAKETQSDLLINAGRDAKLFCDDIEEKYAAVNVNGHIEVYKIGSKKFKMWLTKKYYDETGKAPSSDAMNQALGVFEMKAMYEGDERTLARRCTKHEGKYYYDLADSNWRNVEISKDGWRIVDDAPILFVRNKNMKSQVLPVQYDDLSILDKHYRYKNKEDAILHKVNMVTKFIPDIAHPIDVIHGEKGASKTTSMKKDRSIVDPAVRDVVSMPTSKEDLALILSNNYMPCFDNLDNITAEKSDMLCMAATGGGFSKRTLFTDDDETILYFKEPVSLNGINVVATRADLLDRSILLELERIPPEERKEEKVIWEEFEKDKPKILGGIFTTLSKAMTIYDSVELDRMGRMADFTRWGYAVAEAASIGGEAFLDAYLNNQSRANEEAVESNPVAAAVIKLMNDTNRWDGTVGRLLGELNRIAEKESINVHSKLWAKEPNVLSRRLKEVKSNLELLGIYYTIRPRSKGKKITITKGTANTEIVRPIDDVDEVVDNGFDELFGD
ncbi:hypothetical protein [Clostridium muellerianum]|uniref:hypothetical protein n=1 Tax=Clostridium muellerianum TaxID=2716538 RepID=UPI001980C1AF|nr:hypothetical protein [Clostridium muellerianum]